MLPLQLKGASQGLHSLSHPAQPISFVYRRVSSIVLNRKRVAPILYGEVQPTGSRLRMADHVCHCFSQCEREHRLFGRVKGP